LVAERYGWARWNKGPCRGPAANRNSGVQASTGRWIFFLDDDCIPDPMWLRAYFDAIARSPECRVFEGKTVADRERRRMDDESPLNTHGGYLWSCNMAIDREVFARFGGFCESFPYAAMEDVDLRLRLEADRERFEFVDGAEVCHPYRQAKG